MSGRKRKEQIREMAAKAGARLREERRPFNELCELLENGTDEEFQARLEKAVADGSDIVSHLDGLHGTLLHMAAARNRAEAVKLLVRAGFSPDVKCGGTTPLHSAATHSAPDAVKALAALGADVDARDSAQSAPMHRAALYRKHTDEESFETIKALLDAGADPHAKDEFDLEPVNWFATKPAQRRYLAMIGEESAGKLPPRFMYTHDYNGRLILARKEESLWYGRIDD